MSLLAIIALVGVISVVELKVAERRLEQYAALRGDSPLTQVLPVEGDQMLMGADGTLHRPDCTHIAAPAKLVIYRREEMADMRLCPDCFPGSISPAEVP